jgi:hypothetical protein
MSRNFALLKAMLFGSLFTILVIYGGWKAIAALLGIIVLFRMMLLVYRIWYLVRLPRATVEVNGYTINFPYATSNVGPFTYFENVIPSTIEKSGVWFTDLTAVRTLLLPPPMHEPLEGFHPAKLVLKERTFNFTMVSERAHCECGVTPPHWSGNRYIGTFVFSEGSEHWLGTIDVIKIDGGSKRRVPKKESLKKGQLLPGLSPFPAQFHN